MKNVIIGVSLIVCVACTKSKESYNPADHLSPSQQEAIKETLVRNIAKQPDRDEKREPEYFKEKAAQARLEKYFVKGDDFYFLISQIAPSLIEKRHATGGRFRLNDKGEVTEYEEVFRTWKMVPDTLSRRATFLFDRMVKGEDLEPYYPKNTGDQYIEFPDDRTYYDVAARQWKVK